MHVAKVHSDQLIEVTNSKLLKEFVGFPLELYKDNPYFVPGIKRGELKNLTPNNNPASKFCKSKKWLIYKDDKVAGRIAGIINYRYIELTGNDQARFSWLDFIDENETADTLLKTVEDWAVSEGMKSIIGPYGFTNFDPHGLLIEGFNELATSSSNYNYPYYREALERNGYEKAVDWVEYSIKVPDGIPEKMKRIADIAEQRNELHVAEVKSSGDLLKYKDQFFDLLNRSYREIFGMVPLDEEQKEQLYEGYFKFLDPRYVCLVLDKNEKLAAFGISVPSVSKALQKSGGNLYPFGIFHLWRAMKKNDTIDLLLVGVRPDLQNKGVNSILFRELIPRYIENGIKYVETTQNQDNNERVQAQWKYFDGRQHKRSRCYVKRLG